jgi:hypothetical protein
MTDDVVRAERGNEGEGNTSSWYTDIQGGGGVKGEGGLQGSLGRRDAGDTRHRGLRRKGGDFGSLRHDCLTGLAGLTGAAMDREGGQDNAAGTVPSCFCKTGLEDNGSTVKFNIILGISDGHLKVILHSSFQGDTPSYTSLRNRRSRTWQA